MITVEINDAQIKEIEKQLGSIKTEAPKILARAINRASSTAKVNLSKEAKKQFTYKGDYRKEIKFSKAAVSNLKAEMVSKGKRTSLHKFKFSPGEVNHKNPSSKYQYQIRKNEGTKDFTGMFLQKIRYNWQQGAERAEAMEAKLWKRTGKTRYPVKLLHGPSIPEMFSDSPVVDVALTEAQKTLEKRIQHEINYCLSKQGN